MVRRSFIGLAGLWVSVGADLAPDASCQDGSADAAQCATKGEALLQHVARAREQVFSPPEHTRIEGHNHSIYPPPGMLQTETTCGSGEMKVLDKCVSRPDTNEGVWLKAHNIFRCMHGAPALTWSEPVGNGAQKWADGLTSLVHDQTYQLKPPEGPCGENIAMGYGSAEASTTAWYKEVDCCSWPGCQKGSCTTGHFTAIVWKGVKKLGCGIKDNKWFVCRYWSGDSLDANTANMMGHYDTMVQQKSKTIDECIAEVEGNPVPTPSGSPPTPSGPAPTPAGNPPSGPSPIVPGPAGPPGPPGPLGNPGPAGEAR